jgi:hypothetical protein
MCEQHPRRAEVEEELPRRRMIREDARAQNPRVRENVDTRVSDQRFLDELLTDVGLAARDEGRMVKDKDARHGDYKEITHPGLSRAGSEQTRDLFNKAAHAGTSRAGGDRDRDTDRGEVAVVRMHAHEAAQDPTLWREWVAADTIPARVTRQAALVPEIRSYFAYGRLTAPDRAAFDTLMRLATMMIDLTLIDEEAAAISPPAFSAIMRFIATDLFAMRVGALHGAQKRTAFVLSQTTDKIFGPFKDEVAALGAPTSSGAGGAAGAGDSARRRQAARNAAFRNRQSAGNGQPTATAAAPSAPAGPKGGTNKPPPKKTP